MVGRCTRPYYPRCTFNVLLLPDPEPFDAMVKTVIAAPFIDQRTRALNLAMNL